MIFLISLNFVYGKVRHIQWIYNKFYMCLVRSLYYARCYKSIYYTWTKTFY